MKYIICLLFIFVASNASAQEQKPVIEPVKFTYNNTISFYYGRRAKQWFSQIIKNPFGVNFLDDEIITAAYSRKLWDLGSGFSVELEGYLTLHLYEGGFAEGGGNLFIRFDRFPWNDYIHTTFALSLLGPSYVTQVSEREKGHAPDGKGSKFLNNFMPEFTFALPRHPEWALMVRLHHRSGVFHLIKDITVGSNFVSFGIKHYF